MSESFTELLGGFFLPLACLTADDHDVVVVADPIDPNGANRESFESRNFLPVTVSAFHYSGVAAPQL